MFALELTASAATVASVFLTVRRSLWQFPVGLVATTLYLLVFAQSRLYGSAALQVVFTAVQIYGWWFWLRGDQGRQPPIQVWPWLSIAAVVLVACLAGGLAGLALAHWSDAALPVVDAGIFALSLAAQFLLDRKVIQHWLLWAVVNVVSIGVYATQGLWPTTSLYGFLLVNVIVGWIVWRRAMRSSEPTA